MTERDEKERRRGGGTKGRQRGRTDWWRGKGRKRHTDRRLERVKKTNGNGKKKWEERKNGKWRGGEAEMTETEGYRERVTEKHRERETDEQTHGETTAEMSDIGI